MKNKIALVTGGSRGNGRSTVLEFARQNISTVFTYNQNKEEAAQVITKVENLGQKAVALSLNIAEASSFEAFAKQVKIELERLGFEKLDILVNNAGTSHHNEILMTTEEELDTLYQVHLKGPFFLTQKIAPLLKDGANIVNTSTGLTRFTVQGSGAYASVKAAIETFTKYLALELGKHGIRVNVIAPGPIATDFSGGMVRDNEEVNKQLSEMTSLGRVGLPSDVAKATAAIVSDANNFVTAQRIEVSGGISL